MAPSRKHTFFVEYVCLYVRFLGWFPPIVEFSYLLNATVHRQLGNPSDMGCTFASTCLNVARV